MPKTTKVAPKKRKAAVKKVTGTKKKIAKKTLTKTFYQAKKSQSKEKFSFFLGILVIITGASIMVELLSISFCANNSSFTKDFFLFPIAMIFLLLGIGIVTNRSFYSEN